MSYPKNCSSLPVESITTRHIYDVRYLFSRVQGCSTQYAVRVHSGVVTRQLSPRARSMIDWRMGRLCASAVLKHNSKLRA